MAYVISYVINGDSTMISMTATEARKQLYALVDDVADSHEPIQIAGKRHSAVLVSEDDWRAVQETLYLMGIPGMRESVRKGLKTPVEKCDKALDW
jgi:prevent-host-death family protein